MLALQPVDTAVTAFRPDPITQDEAAAMFRAVLNLFGKWELTDEQAATLLDMPVRSYRRWKAEGPGRVSRDGRVSIGVQSGPPIGVQKGPPCSCGDWLMLGACFALLAA